MPSFVPPKRATALDFWVSLTSQLDTKLFQTNPTLAAGDVKVSKDGGALANLTTLPIVTPAAGKLVKISLSSTEMTADNVTVIFSDAAGAEWSDLQINIQTVARQIDDLAFPAVSGRSINVSAGGLVDAAVISIAAAAIDAAQFTQAAADKVWATTTRTVTGFVAGAITAASFTAGAIDAAAIASNALDAVKFTAAACSKFADHIWRRQLVNVAASADGDAVIGRSPLGGIRKLVNRVRVAAGVMTVYNEDDTAAAYTETVTATPGANPITELDPT